MRTKDKLLLGGIVTLVALTLFAAPFLFATKGVSFDITNQYGEPIQGATCEVYGSPTAYCSSSSSGYCFSSETSSYADAIYSYSCICRSNNRHVSGSVQVWSLGIKNYDVMLQDCESGYQAPTTTLSSYCTPNGEIPNPLYASQCCSGCMSTSAYNYVCKACEITTTVRTTVVTSFTPTTTRPPTSCNNPYASSGSIVCDGDSKKQCYCGTTCYWTVIGTCGGGDEETTTTLPPSGEYCSSPHGISGSVICSALDSLQCECYDGNCGWYRIGSCGGTTTTIPSGGEGDLTSILIVGLIVVGVGYVILKKK